MTVKLVTDSTSYIQEETLRDLDNCKSAVNFPGESLTKKAPIMMIFINELKGLFLFTQPSRYYDRHF